MENPKNLTSPNEQLKEYLSYYLSVKPIPKFAVMIDGKWGSGKSYTVTQFLEAHASSGKDVNVYQVSLFGVKSWAEIDAKVKAAIYPFLDKDTDRGKITAVGQAMLKSWLNFEIDAQKLLNIKPGIFVFDDFERSSLSPEETLGYINQYTEGSDNQVIIISNEDEVVSQEKFYQKEIDSKSEKQIEHPRSYKRIKEKVVGVTFKVHPDVDAVLDSILETVKINKTSNRQLLQNNRNVIIEIFNRSNCNNLRSLERAVYEYLRLMDYIQEKHKKNSDFITEVITSILSLSFAIKGNIFSKTELEDMIEDRVFTHDLDENSAIAKFRKKFPEVNYYRSSIGLKNLIEYLLSGKISKEEIELNIESSIHFRDARNTPTWRFLWDTRGLTEDEIISTYEKLESELKERKYNNVSELIMVFSILLIASDKKFIRRSKASLLKECKQYILHLENMGQLHPQKTVNNIVAYPLNSHDSHQFLDIQSIEMQTILEYLKKIQAKLFDHKFKAEATQILNWIKHDLDALLTKFNSDDWGVDCRRYPCLHLISVHKFFKAFCELSLPDQFALLAAMNNRYRNHPPKEDMEFSIEKEWLEKLRGKFSKYVVTLKNKNRPIAANYFEKYENDFFKKWLD